MIVIGVDPGIGCTGYGIIEAPSKIVAFGTIRPPARAELATKLLHVSEKLQRLLGEHRPDHCVVENIFHAVNAKSALVLGHVRGAILLTALKNGCTVYEYTALQIKKAVTGYGHAEKEQVRAMVRILLNLPNAPLAIDSSDALAAAICHAQTHLTRERMADMIGSSRTGKQR
ncbi:MAG: crossover junction endodeoxyribonuclease RuvC [Acidobacteriota bacterium]